VEPLVRFTSRHLERCSQALAEHVVAVGIVEVLDAACAVQPMLADVAAMGHVVVLADPVTRIALRPDHAAWPQVVVAA
jgi:hypothetical protein